MRRSHATESTSRGQSSTECSGSLPQGTRGDDGPVTAPAEPDQHTSSTMEAMIQSGIENGCPRRWQRLVLHTVFGRKLAMESDLDPTSLREAVTSRGGTTDAAISHLEENDYARIVVEAILAAMIAQRTRQRKLTPPD